MDNNYLSSDLTVEEARQLADEINHGISVTSEKTLRFYDGRGWKVLGYSSWRECATIEFNLKDSRVYQLLDFARIERNLENSTIGGILPSNERQARPLTPLGSSQQIVAWEKAVSNAKNSQPTAKEVQQAVNEVKAINGDLSQQKIIELFEPEIPEMATIPLDSPPKTYYTVNEWDGLSLPQRIEALSTEGNKHFNKQDSDNIEWARWSWNPITGCLHNCAYCYARDIANRFYPQGFEPVLIPDRLSAPANTNPPNFGKFSNSVDRTGWRNVFTCSMADLFGKWVPQDWIEAVLEQVRNNPQWTFLFLTKFPIRMAEFEYPSNVWLGTSVDYQWAVERAEKAFRKIKDSGFMGICWLSCEPMMERLTFSSLDMFDWVVIGGSSKSTQTPEFKPPREWVNELEEQARKHGVKFYEKSNLLERIREYPIIDE